VRRPAALALLAAVLAGTPAGAEPRATLEVVVRALRSDRGLVRAKLVAAPEGFPASDAHVVAKQKHPIRGDLVRLVFGDLPYGAYALVVLHDEDDDGALARGWLGLPAEGLAFSNGARVRLGPPSFQEARFALDRPHVALELDVQY
jgi:uncharacterized protein (DUF2141 family)